MGTVRRGRRPVAVAAAGSAVVEAAGAAGGAPEGADVGSWLMLVSLCSSGSGASRTCEAPDGGTTRMDQRVLFLVNGRMTSMLVLSTKEGPVSTGSPPPMSLPFFLLRYSEVTAR